MSLLKKSDDLRYQKGRKASDFSKAFGHFIFELILRRNVAVIFVNVQPMKLPFLFFLLYLCSFTFAQENLLLTNSVAEQVLLGNYDPATYAPETSLINPQELVADINASVSRDSLKSYLFGLRQFETRNTGSDTLSPTRGIGAARRWVYSRFQDFRTQRNDRLLVSYFQFDQEICGMNRHRNVIAVLPGLDTTDKSILIIEGHLDSRCDGRCDVDCVAEGMEDNASGTALVMEMARVMSQYAFNHTIVFMATTGEEQGLLGANAFAEYTRQQDIEVKAVLNNDIVGGIICGATSSQPSCPGLNHIDSTQVRLFSAGGFNSRHKQLSRFIKLEYEENLRPIVDVRMLLTVMSAEDRSGRGGDHIPFRERAIPAMRFTSANEHGNASHNANYTDRQHTSEDILGVDTDGDSVIDSFFVDFNYLARNAVINGNAAAMLAIGPKMEAEFIPNRVGDSIHVTIDDLLGYNNYKVLQRTNTNDFEAVYTITEGNSIRIPKLATLDYISIAAVDSNGVESIFSEEIFARVFTSVEEPVIIEPEEKNIQLLQNRPNPFDEATIISFWADHPVPYKQAYVLISDMNGKEIQRLPTDILQGMNEVLYTHGYNANGIYAYSLIVDGKRVDTRRMIFAN